MPGTDTWIYSRTADTLFAFSSWIAVASLCVNIVLIAIGPFPEVRFDHTPLNLIVFGIMFVLVGISLISQFYLFFGMLYFCAFRDRRGMILRVICVLIQLFFLTLGSALIYAIVFRPQRRDIMNKHTHNHDLFTIESNS
jgi:hypothetical protein